jgi:ABC-2 type transport system ATP-binding protein
MITVKDLTKIYKTPVKSGNLFNNIFKREYKKYTALDKINFEIGENELIGFIGPNGAGKTTTMKILAGILYPTSGSVKIMNEVPFNKHPSFLKNIAFVMGQKNQMLWELPASDTFNLNKAIYEVPDDKFNNHVNELIELLDCKNFINQPVKTLSLGQRMRVELIASLIHQPKILFLDEPTIGLDIFAQTTIINFIKEYQKRHKATIILTSHYMQDVERLAERVILIDKGKIIFDNSLELLVNNSSQYKTITVQLASELKHKLDLPKNISYDLKFPELIINIPKNNVADILPSILKQLDFIDITIEDEALEDVIKKTFSSSQNKA